MGDHLFFIPLIRSFIDSGYHVEVGVSPLMADFFKRLGFSVLSSSPSYNDYDLTISRFELIPQLSQFKSLLVHVSQNLTMPICNQLLHTFSAHFQRTFDSRTSYDVFTNSKILKTLELPEDKRLILFNPYCDSSSYLINKTKVDQLLKALEPFAGEPGYTIVLMGTQKEKEKDPAHYSDRYFDLRGKTDVVDIFELVNDPRVELYVGFDAFIMHVFSLFGKRSLVKFRGRLTKRQTKMLSKYHVNLFSDHHFVTLI